MRSPTDDLPSRSRASGRSGPALALALLLLAPPALALEDGARLLPSLDAGGPAARATLPAEASLAEPTARGSEHPWVTWYLVGASTTVVAIPAGLFLGTLIGSASNNLLLAALPSLLVFAALPPLAVTWAEWLISNQDAPGTTRFLPAFWVALGVHVAATVAAIALGVSVLDLASVALLTLAEALVLPAAITLTLRLGVPDASATAAALPDRPPRLPEPPPAREAMPRAPVVSLLALAF